MDDLFSQIIAKYVDSVEEVKFGSYAPGSLTYNICNDLNKKASKKYLNKFKYSWFKNGELKEKVSRVLAQKQNNLNNFDFNQDCKSESNSSIITCSMSELSDSVCKMSISSDKSFKSPRPLKIVPKFKHHLQFKQIDKNYKISNTKFLSEDQSINKISLKSYLITVIEKKKVCSCLLSFYNVRINKNTRIVAYAKCLYKSVHSKIFKFEITLDLESGFSKVKIFSCGADAISHPGVRKFKTIVGENRNKIKEQLRTKTAFEIHTKMFNNIDIPRAINGDFQDLCSLNTVQKINSELKAENDLDPDDVLDIVKMMGGSNGYVQTFCADTFTIGLFMSQQIDLLKTISKITKKQMFVHFDATGQIIRCPKTLTLKRILYYCVVVHFENSIVPIYEFITSEHTAKNIGHMLTSYKNFITRKFPKAWPLFNHMVVDWSWAEINAIIFEYNEQKLITYINSLYENKTDKSLIYVHICCSHFIKIIINQLSKKTVNVNAKTLIIEIFCRMIECKVLVDLGKIFYAFCVLVDSKYISSNYSQQMKFLSKVTFSVTEPSKKIESEDEDSNKSNYSQSMYYKYFLEIYDRFVSENKMIVSGEANKFYCPDFITFILKQYMPYVCLWSSLFLPEKTSRISNAVVENWNNIVKHDILKVVNEKGGRVIRKLQSRISDMVNKIQVNHMINDGRSKLATPKTSSKNEPFDENSTENWQKRTPSRHQKKNTYFGRNLLEKMILPLSKITLAKYDNGIIKNIEYYKKLSLLNQPLDFILAKFDSVERFGNQFGYVYSEDFFSLFDKKWLTTSIIDSCASMFFKDNSKVQRHISYVPINYGTIIFTEPNTKFYNNDIFKIKFSATTLMPFLYKNHYFLVIIDNIKKTFQLIDPFGENIHMLELAFANFKIFINSYNIKVPRDTFNIDNFKAIGAKDFPIQVDSYNCGVFVISYLEKFITNKKYDKGFSFNAEIYRNKLTEDILQKSDNLNNLCLKCCKKGVNNNFKKYVYCCKCKRWYHEHCYQSTFRPEDICFLCKEIVNDLN